MTNFEKWKKGLKPEDLVVDRGESVDKDEYRLVAGFGDKCENCPVKKAGSCGADYWKECGEVFLEWANEEVDE